MIIISPFTRQSRLFRSSPWVSGCCWPTKPCNYAVCIQIAIFIVSLLGLSVCSSSPCPLGYLPACDCSLRQKTSEHNQRRFKTIALSGDLLQFVTAATRETLYLIAVRQDFFSLSFRVIRHTYSYEKTVPHASDLQYTTIAIFDRFCTILARRTEYVARGTRTLFATYSVRRSC